MISSTDYEAPTWNQIYEMLLCQAKKIQTQNYKSDLIVGIAKGGVIPARILTDLLEAPQLTTIQTEFYTDLNQTKQEPTVKQALNILIEGKKTLLVDDIADSGKSLQLALNHLKQQGVQEIRTATLYWKPQSAVVPDFWEKQTSLWVVFPWERKETLRKIIQHQQGKRALNREVTKLVKAGFPKQIASKLLKKM